MASGQASLKHACPPCVRTPTTHAPALPYLVSADDWQADEQRCEHARLLLRVAVSYKMPAGLVQQELVEARLHACALILTEAGCHVCAGREVHAGAVRPHPRAGAFESQHAWRCTRSVGDSAWRSGRCHLP